jgi:hypothetical protein
MEAEESRERIDAVLLAEAHRREVRGQADAEREG